MTWIVDVLEKGKSDFVKEKLSILGEKYDAASAIYILNHKMMFAIVFSRKKLYNIIILTETTKHFCGLRGK